MRISRAHYDEMVAHALEAAPNECCGIVATRDGDARRVYRATNVEASPFRFEIDGREQLRILNEIEQEGHELGAIYHSHTRTEPLPSQTDINFAANWPGVVWIILGLAGDQVDVRGFTIEEGKVSEAELILG